MATVAGARTIPFDWYSDPAVLRLERERIFRRAWQYAGRADQVAETGDYFTCDLGGVPVVVVRAEDGVRAFLNVCRHRGSLVCEGAGRRATLQCPYHAWTYGLDGSLRSAPRSEREPGFDRDGLGLLPASVDTWGPFVFVNPDAQAAPLADTIGELPELLAASLDLDSLRFLHRASGPEYAANWKVCCENFLECYHCQVAHPGFSKVVDVSQDAYVLEAGRLFSTQYGPLRERRQQGGFDPRGPVERGQFHFLWPNVTINVMPGQPNLSIGPVVPTGPETAARFLDYFAGPEVEEEWIADMLEFDDQVGAEDRVLVERVQKGLRSGAVEHGRLMEDPERLIAHFQGLLLDALA